jgi:N-acyl amino acid synthase of PEP-CTERM/exosortase system
MDDADTLFRALGDVREGFRTRFEVVPAITEELKDAAFRVRHSVYCEDLGFEPIRPDGREIDRYDAHAIAILLRNMETGMFIGCARLIMTCADARDELLPFEHMCRGTLNWDLINQAPVPRDRIAEVSRLAVIRQFRRRKGEDRSPAPLSGEDLGNGPIPRFPYILLGLYLGVVALGSVHKLQRLYLLSEPRLAHHFSRLGVEIMQVDEPVQHRGTRVPSMISVPRLVDGLNRYVRPLYESVLRQVTAAYDRVTL